MEEDHEKRMREAVEKDRAKIINNSSAGGTNDAVPDLSMPSLMSELIDDKKTRMTGIECKDKDREEEETMRDMGEEVSKTFTDKFCANLKHRLEATRKDRERLTREALDSMRDQ